MSAQLSAQNSRACHLRILHRPYSPLILPHVYDAPTTLAALSHPSVTCIATASYAIASTLGISDSSLTLDDNLSRLRIIANTIAASGKPDTPLTADLQDGYDDISTTIKKAIEVGVVGCNIEDVDNAGGETLRSKAVAVERIKLAKAAAVEAGVPDFVINARTDTLAFGSDVDDAIERGRAYLEAGATTVFVWGGAGGRGVRTEEVKRLVQGLDGMVSVKMSLGEGFLKTAELKELGVARVSVGPELFRVAMTAYREAVGKMLDD